MFTGGVVSIQNSTYFSHSSSVFVALKVRQRLAYYPSTMCVCASSVMVWLIFQNAKSKPDTFHGVLHFGYFYPNFITH